MKDNPVGFETITWGFSADQLRQAWKDISELGFQYFEVLNMASLVEDYERRNLRVGPVWFPRLMNDTEYLAWLALLTEAKRDYGLQITSIYTEAEYLSPKLWDLELAQFTSMALILKGLGAEYLICAGGPAAVTSEHTPEQYQAMGRALNAVGERCREFGIRLCYHPHFDTFVQTEDELKGLVAATDPKLVGLCIDPAHFVLKGGDPVRVFRDHIDRIEYVHLKDIASGDPTQWSGRGRNEAFAELGTGQIDLKAIVDLLDANHYSGPFIVELDISKTTARESAEANRAYLRDGLGLSW